MERRPTLRDIALAVGCTNATVSLALRGSVRISAATRERVVEAARAMGYRPDPILSALASHRWNRPASAQGATLAAVGDRLEGVAGMEERACAYGYRLERFLCADHPDPRGLSRMLYHRGILGVLVGQVFTPGFCSAFDWSRFVAVACSEGVERPPVHLVMPNHFRAVQAAWDRAWAAGRRRIGLLIFDIPGAVDLQDRRAAFLDRQQAAGVQPCLPVLNLPPWTHAEARDLNGRFPHAEAVARVRAWMSRHKPDAVLGFNSAFLWLLREAGCRIPNRRLDFLDLWVSQPTPQARGFCLHPDVVGRRAVEWLDALLRAGERGCPGNPSTMSVDLVWQDGADAAASAGTARRR